jgi:hypothetical protein
MALPDEERQLVGVAVGEKDDVHGDAGARRGVQDTAAAERLVVRMRCQDEHAVRLLERHGRRLGEPGLRQEQHAAQRERPRHAKEPASHVPSPYWVGRPRSRFRPA